LHASGKRSSSGISSLCADGEMKMRQDGSIIANLLSHFGQASKAHMQSSTSQRRAPRRSQLEQKKSLGRFPKTRVRPPGGLFQFELARKCHLLAP
jgi:hypothetical protein